MISSKYNMYFNSNDAAVSLLLLPMCCFMVTSSNGNISALLALCAGNSPVTGEFLSENASDAELWCFLWSAPERTAELTIETVIWDAIALIITSCHCNEKCSKMHEIWATVRLAELLCSKDRFQFYERLVSALQWRHNGRNCVSNHQPYDCLLNVCSDADQRKHQSSASLAFVWGNHRWPVNSQHKCPVTRKMIPFDDVIMCTIATPTTRWSLGTCT